MSLDHLTRAGFHYRDDLLFRDLVVAIEVVVQDLRDSLRSPLRYCDFAKVINPLSANAAFVRITLIEGG